MFYFADIDEKGVCKTISGYGEPRENTASQVPIETHDVSIIGKRWNGTEWEEYIPPKPEPEPIPEPTQLDRIEEKVNEIASESISISKVEAAIMEGVNDV